MDRMSRIEKYRKILQQVVKKPVDIKFHLRLKDGKVWVEWDDIEYGIVRDLVAAGIPKEDIVMAFYGRKPRPLTELMAA